MNIFKTTTNNIMSILGMYAAVALKEAAEKVVEERVKSYRDLVSKAVYEEAEKIALRYEQELTADSSKPRLKIIIDDRREKIK